MPAYNFQKQFSQEVRDGIKRQTIRKPRKRPTVAGDMLYLYTGMRQKNCELLREETCLSVHSLRIWMEENPPIVGGYKLTSIQVDGSPIPELDWHEFVKADGFKCIQDFTAFFAQYEKDTPLELIKW